MKKSKIAKFDVSAIVNCPHCGEVQDLIVQWWDYRLPEDASLSDIFGDQIKNFETWCLDCGEHFIVPKLLW